MIVNNESVKIPASIFLFFASGDLDAEKTTKNNPKKLMPNATIAKLFSLLSVSTKEHRLIVVPLKTLLKRYHFFFYSFHIHQQFPAYFKFELNAIMRSTVSSK